ncbi:thiamine pyrophosphate-dependent enzyme [Nocardioides sp. YIM 152588]|uniref:thiamine pyrophosphate-dependent enzyme n=1 Tax=Nocardioides sp. YIM 152588 TaxID=3158259 RepID=UPI0032E46AEA
MVVEEAITLGLPLRRALRIDRPGHYLHTIGGGLGWGIGAAVGARLGRPDLPVVAVVGDGCATFGMHGLWTAAHQRTPVLVVVANNGEYRTLKQTTLAHGGAAARSRTFLGMDLAEPRLDWASLATGLGVTATRVTAAADLAAVVAEADRLSAPLLVDLAVAPLAEDER